MKLKLFIILSFIILTDACRKSSVAPQQMNLGTTPTTTSFRDFNPIFNTPVVNVPLNVTPGAKYNLMVTDFLGNKVSSFGFTADSNIYNKSINISNIKNGDYNLLLLDISGNQKKVNIIIKK